MIYTSPVTGDVRQEPIAWRPRTAFVMQAQGAPLPRALTATRRTVDRELKAAGYRVADARSLTTGRDYLLKIWELVLGCPIGVAIVHEGIRSETLANIYFELGMMLAYGREAIVVRVGEAPVPSDFSRTEWIPAGRGFKARFARFIDSLNQRGEYYAKLAGNVERNPLLAADYYRRACLLSGDRTHHERASKVFGGVHSENRSADSVEALMLAF